MIFNYVSQLCVQQILITVNAYRVSKTCLWILTVTLHPSTAAKLGKAMRKLVSGVEDKV